MPLQKDISNFKILVVEDRADARAMMRNMLMDMGITQIYEASNGREGLSFLDLAPDMVDLVMCDWNMPGLDGLALLRQLRTVDPDLPFLMVTGRADMDSVFEAKSAGVTGFIKKPFSPSQLEAKMRIVANRSAK